MAWNDYLIRSEALSAIFGGEYSASPAVWVEEIQLRPDGPTATMHLNLRDYPTTPPRKWEDRNCTTVHIELAAIGVTAIAIDRLGSIQAAELSISATHGGGRLVLVESDHTRIEIECDFAEVRSVSAH